MDRIEPAHSRRRRWRPARSSPHGAGVGGGRWRLDIDQNGAPQGTSIEIWNIRPEVPSRLSCPAITGLNCQPSPATMPGEKPL